MSHWLIWAGSQSCCVFFLFFLASSKILTFSIFKLQAFVYLQMILGVHSSLYVVILFLHIATKCLYLIGATSAEPLVSFVTLSFYKQGTVVGLKRQPLLFICSHTLVGAKQRQEKKWLIIELGTSDHQMELKTSPPCQRRVLLNMWIHWPNPEASDVTWSEYVSLFVWHKSSIFAEENFVVIHHDSHWLKTSQPWV